MPCGSNFEGRLKLYELYVHRSAEEPRIRALGKSALVYEKLHILFEQPAEFTIFFVVGQFKKQEIQKNRERTELSVGSELRRIGTPRLEKVGMCINESIFPRYIYSASPLRFSVSAPSCKIPLQDASLAPATS